MRARKRTLPCFEAASVALFTLLLIGGALHAHAQTPAAAMPASGADPIAAYMQRAADAPESWALSQISEAFQRTDANGDGVISREEAKIWTGLTRQFDHFDTDRDGKLSNAEFTQALK
jgi:hypothetical protein